MMRERGVRRGVLVVYAYSAGYYSRRDARAARIARRNARPVWLPVAAATYFTLFITLFHAYYVYPRVIEC